MSPARFCHLVDLETILLQKLGPACVAAFNAFTMCADLPKVAFLAMDARHCAGLEMAETDGLCRQRRLGPGQAQGGRQGLRRQCDRGDGPLLRPGATARGTMPHALIGYAGSTVRAAEMFHETFPGEDMTVLVDYFGREVSDSLAVCRRFPEMAAAGQAGRSHRYRRQPLRRGARSAGLLCRARAPCAGGDPRLSQRGGAALSRRRRRLRRGLLSSARRARRRGLRQGQARRLLRLRSRPNAG